MALLAGAAGSGTIARTRTLGLALTLFPTQFATWKGKARPWACMALSADRFRLYHQAIAVHSFKTGAEDRVDLPWRRWSVSGEFCLPHFYNPLGPSSTPGSLQKAATGGAFTTFEGLFNNDSCILLTRETMPPRRCVQLCLAPSLSSAAVLFPPLTPHSAPGARAVHYKTHF